MAYKTFVNGFPLNASELNTFLMNQSVATFADATARTAAIATPAEGQLTYLESDESFYKFDGTNWVKLTGMSNDLVAQSHNYIINGAFDVWQRGTSFTSAAYTADRWLLSTAGGAFTGSVSQQTFSPNDLSVTGFGDANYYSSLSLTDAASLSVFELRQRVEDVRTLANQTFTFSFWAKADSARTVTWAAIQNFGSGGSTAVTAHTASFSVDTTWQRFTYTETMPSISGKTIGSGSYLEIQIEPPIVSGMTLDIWGVQLEAGSVATPFKRHAPSLQGELAACQRYYQRFIGGGNDYLMNMSVASGFADGALQFMQSMRSAPTFTLGGAVSDYRVYEAGSTKTPTDIYMSYCSNPQVGRVRATATGLTTGNAATLLFANSNGYIELSAEL